MSKLKELSKLERLARDKYNVAKINWHKALDAKVAEEQKSLHIVKTINRIKDMTDEDVRISLETAGIITKCGQLTDKYKK